MRTLRTTLILAILVAAAAATSAPAAVTDGEIGPALSTTGNGRALQPAGRLTTLGNFPSGGALTPDGRFYWAVDSGLGHNDVKIVDVATGAVTQSLPLPGAYGAIAFAPDGHAAYVSGEPKGDVPAEGPTKGDAGDVIHVFGIDPASGQATEQDPIALPAPSSGLDWPQGLAVTPGGGSLVVALDQQAQVAIVDLATKTTRLVGVDPYPYGVAITRDGTTALVTSEQSGNVQAIDLASGTVRGNIPVGATDGLAAAFSHPQGVVVDPRRPLAYVAVSARDQVAVIDTTTLTIARTISLRRVAGLGVQPVDLAVAPGGDTLYVADSGEDAVAVIALSAKRPAARAKRGRRSQGRRGHAAKAVRPFSLVGRIPTAAYPTGVAVTPDGRRLVWLAAKGLGVGPNPTYVQFSFNAAPYGSYTPEALIGRLGVLPRPTDARVKALTRQANLQVRPANAVTTPPIDTPVVGPDGGPSRQIKHVFYIVRENRVYDQIFGTDPRGDGDPKLELFDDNGVNTPAGGVTPNAHRLVKTFPLIDHFYANSEVSIDGHIITSAAWAIDHDQRTLHANYGNRGRSGDTADLIGMPPMASVFDQAARQGVSFKNFGETTGGAGSSQDDGRPTYQTVKDNTDPTYQTVDTDAGASLPLGAQSGATPGGHLDLYRAAFEQQLATNSVPALTYITLPIDHTLGTVPGVPTPKAFVADNDLALGQFVELISQSPIWKDSAIFVVEDDSQDGADHVDAHRMPMFVISPTRRRARSSTPATTRTRRCGRSS